MHSSALSQHLAPQRHCPVPKPRQSLPRSVPFLPAPQQHAGRRGSVAVGSGSFGAGLDAIDWSGLSRMLLPPMLSAAVLRKASNSLAKRAAIDEVCRAFRVQDKEELQVRSSRVGVCRTLCWDVQSSNCVECVWTVQEGLGLCVPTAVPSLELKLPWQTQSAPPHMPRFSPLPTPPTLVHPSISPICGVV